MVADVLDLSDSDGVTELTLRLQVDEHEAVVSVGGDVDAITAPAVRAWLERAANECVVNVVVDLSLVTFADGSAVNALLAARTRLAETKRSLRIRNAPSSVARLLSVAGLELLPSEDHPATKSDQDAPSESDSTWALAEEIDGLRRAMETRAVIEQAKGVIMGATNCDADRAFDLLRQQSQHQNRKLRDIASEIVAAVARPRVRSSEQP